MVLIVKNHVFSRLPRFFERQIPVFEKRFDIRFVQGDSQREGEIDTFLVIEYIEVIECFTFFPDTFFAHVLFEYDPEIGSFEFVYGCTGFQENLLQYFPDFFHEIIPFPSPENIVYIEHIVDMEDGERAIFIHSEILQTFFMVGKSGEAIDFLVQSFVGLGNILTYHFETRYIAGIVSLRYDKGPQPDKGPVFPPVAYISRPGSSGPDGGQEIVPKFSGLHSGAEYAHIFSDKFFSGVSGMLYNDVVHREDRSLEVHIERSLVHVKNIQFLLYGCRFMYQVAYLSLQMPILDLQVISLLPRNDCLDNDGCYIFYRRSREPLPDKFIDGLFAYLSSERIRLEAVQ